MRYNRQITQILILDAAMMSHGILANCIEAMQDLRQDRYAFVCKTRKIRKLKINMLKWNMCGSFCTLYL